MRIPFSSAGAPDGGETGGPTYIKVDAGALDSVFVAPKWLRDAGLTAWFAVGVVLLVAGFVWLFALTSTITIPLLVAGVVAAVAAPVISWQQRHGIPRGAGTLIFVAFIFAVAALFGYAVLSGIVSQRAETVQRLHQASDEVTRWLKDHGIDPGAADKAQSHVNDSTSKSVKTLAEGVAKGIKEVSSLVFFLAMTLISLIFLLKDGPVIRAWTERRMGVPPPVARVITRRLIESLRGYFFGVTIIAIFNGVVVGVGAVLLGVPLVATIVLVTFIGAYIPFLGAWAAGAFSVLIALSAGSQEAVIGMIVVQLLANGVLQQMVQPIAYGAALGIHPLAALAATIGAGCLFGAVGLILGAPLVSAATRISADLANARAARPGGGSEGGDPADGLPLPAG